MSKNAPKAKPSKPAPSVRDAVAGRLAELGALVEAEADAHVRDLLLRLAEQLDTAIVVASVDVRPERGASLAERLAAASEALGDSLSTDSKHARAAQAVEYAIRLGKPPQGLRRYGRGRGEPDHTDEEIRAALERVELQSKGGRGKRGVVDALVKLGGGEPEKIRAALKRAR